jgi:hypothetical protein
MRSERASGLSCRDVSLSSSRCRLGVIARMTWPLRCLCGMQARRSLLRATGGSMPCSRQYLRNSRNVTFLRQARNLRAFSLNGAATGGLGPVAASCINGRALVWLLLAYPTSASQIERCGGLWQPVASIAID